MCINLQAVYYTIIVIVLTFKTQHNKNSGVIWAGANVWSSAMVMFYIAKFHQSSIV